MSLDAAMPIIAAILVWFASTGALLWLAGAPRGAHGAVMAILSVVMAAATAGVVLISGEATVAGALAGFVLGVGIWAWHEAAFLFGFLTGPRRTECPPGLSPWRRFLAASETVIAHEVAIALNAALLVALSWGAANQTAMWTFLLLWGMRLSAKANIFVGAPHLSDELLPERLRYLKSYFGPKRITVFFAVTMILITTITVALAAAALAHPPGAHEGFSLGLLATLAALAVLEHALMAAPVRDAALWTWARRRDAAAADAEFARSSLSTDPPATLARAPFAADGAGRTPCPVPPTSGLRRP
ncbi:MAG: putative photosynthetic complex assembly protein PuhE [Parvularculaceae bacterium]